MINFLIQINKKNITSAKNVFIKKPSVFFPFSNSNYDLLFWGDPIFNNQFKLTSPDIISVKYIIESISGHFYYLLFYKKTKSLFFGNSLFSILPVYYYETQDLLYISENPLTIAEKTGLYNPDRRFILENILFYYPLFNHSCIENIYLLDSNSYIEITNRNIKFHKHTNIADLLISSPISWKKSADLLSDLFINESQKYFPEELYIHSLTGGFDGRTLVSCSLFHKKNFQTYSFGSETSRDTEIASALSAKASIPFIKINLDSNYIQQHSLQNGLEFIRNAGGSASFARAHYLYAAKLLSHKTSYIITGNFGSEILRAVHNLGALISPNLFSIFNSSTVYEAIEQIEHSVEFKCLCKASFKLYWAELKEDIIKLPKYCDLYKNLSLNHQFYIFVFEEILRKYFGAEMINQYYYVINRTPFLDYTFFKAILKTQFFGAYSEFFDNNPFKRYKGQVLYAHIINKAYLPFSKILTDKGYSPSDLLSLYGHLKIGSGYLKKKMNRKYYLSDPFSVRNAFLHNADLMQKIHIDPELFDIQFFDSIFQKDPENFPIIALSQAYFLNFLRKQNDQSESRYSS